MKVKCTKSFKWFITVGTNPGYETTCSDIMPEAEFLTYVRAVTDRVSRETGVYISTIIYPANAVYKAEWGCPDKGEPVYILTGAFNSQFAEAKEYKASLMQYVEELKKSLGQSTITLEIMPSELFYFNGE